MVEPGGVHYYARKVGPRTRAEMVEDDPGGGTSIIVVA